ncbi:MAG: zinc-binding dehydrogenase [Anaerolineae bacterium]|nr:zinc-binding dehydrogenase [Anaerolineae bacterium]
MKGAAAVKPGEVGIIEFAEPDAHADDIILTTSACGICATDLKLVHKGADDPRFALGHELCGVITKASASLAWQVGQRVVVCPYLPCGECFYCRHDQPTLCSHLFESSIMPGALAERVLVPFALAKGGMFAVPDGLPDEIAALSEPLGCVLNGLDDAHFTAGDNLLVIGDGPMGQLAAAAGRTLGAAQVIMSGMTPHRLAIAAELYADHVIDVSNEDLRKQLNALMNGRGVDVVLVTVSSGETLAQGIDVVRPGGYVNAFAGVPGGTEICLDVRKLHYQQYHLTGSFGVDPFHMKKALGELEKNPDTYARIITASYPFSQVAEAITYIEQRVGLKAVVKF